MFACTRLSRLGASPYTAFMIKTKTHPELVACKNIMQRGKLMGKMYRALSVADKAALVKTAAKMHKPAPKLASPGSHAFLKFRKANLKLKKGTKCEMTKATQIVIRNFNKANKLPQLTIGVKKRLRQKMAAKKAAKANLVTKTKKITKKVTKAKKVTKKVAKKVSKK